MTGVQTCALPICVEHSARTSSGMFFSRGQNQLIAAIEERIANVTGIPVENGEGMQVLRYQVGQEYRPHYDQFDLTNPGSTSHISRGGQRIATLLIYLNTPEAGGETVFPNANVSVSAIQGNVLLFRYPNPADTPLTLHGGNPVIKGEKWVATKWMRVGEFK